MTDTAWVALGALAFTIVSCAAGWFWSIILKVGNRLIELNDKVEGNRAVVGNMIRELLDTHERRDQDRHEENVQRLTRLETLVIDNGHHKRRRRAI